MPKCPKCEDGFQIVNVNGMPSKHPCYHCLQTGEISEEQEFADRMETVANQVGSEMADEEQRRIDGDPDGDGYALCAAESGISTLDYKISRALGFSFLAYDEMMRMDKQVRRKVVDIILAGQGRMT